MAAKGFEGRRVKEVYAKHARTPAWTTGTILPATTPAGGAWIKATQVQKDVLQKTSRKSEQAFFLPSDPQAKAVTCPQPTPLHDVVLSAHSPSGRFQAVVRKTKPAPDKPDEHFVEIWGHAGLERTFRTKGKHKQVHGGDTFATLEWSLDESRLLYVAERHTKDKPGWFDAEADADDAEGVGEKFDQQESFGEQLDDVVDPRLVVLDLTTGEFSDPLEGVQGDLAVGQATWAPDGSGIVFTGWPTEGKRRLGLIYCINRRSSIYFVRANRQKDEKPVPISDFQFAARSPSFCPDGSKLIWLENVIGGPHCAASRLVAAVWEDGMDPAVLKPVCVVGVPVDEHRPSLTLHRLPQRCWISPTHVVLDSGVRSARPLFVIDITQPATLEGANITVIDEVIPGLGSGSYGVLDAVFDSGNKVLVTFSSLNRTPLLLVADIDQNSLVNWRLLTEGQDLSGIVSWNLITLPASVSSFEAFVLKPAQTPSSPPPLIVVPHGGPHSAIQSRYFHYYAAFVELGYAALLINYRGSLGYGQDSIECLPGKVGDQDVRDCNAAVDKALESGCADPDRVVVFGGSHGGLLVAHLTAQFPERYKVCAMRNPVVDIPTMVGGTDIPDWCFVESGCQWNESAEQFQLSASSFEQMRLASPMHRVDTVKSPTLVLIGLKDLRVPPQQGRQWYNALRARGVVTKLQQFPQDNHTLSGVECEGEVFVNVCQWFQTHLAQTPSPPSQQ